MQDLRRELESTDDRLLKVEADASASRIESARRNDLIKRWATERVWLVKEELRRTRLEAERYRSGWMRLSGGGGGGRRGGRKRRADAAGSGSGDIGGGGGGGGGGVDNGSRTMADMGRSGRRRRRRRRKRRWGIPLLPSVVVNRSAAVSLAGEVTPQSSDGVGRHGGVGVNGDQGGLTSSGNNQKL